MWRGAAWPLFMINGKCPASVMQDYADTPEGEEICLLCNRENGIVDEGRSHWKVRSGEKNHQVRPEITGIHRWPSLLTFWMLTKECRVERNDLFGCCKTSKRN